MINNTKIKESDSSHSIEDDTFYSIQIVELDHQSYLWVGDIPHKYLVGRVGYKNYKETFCGSINPCRTIEQAEAKFKALCELYGYAEEEVIEETFQKPYDPYLREVSQGKGCADKNDYHSSIGGGQ